MTTAVSDADKIRPAAWHETATEIDGEPDPRKHLTLGEVCSRTGLRDVTIKFAMNRKGRFKNAALREIARPAYSKNGEPRWDPKQVADYFNAINERSRTIEERFGHLPVVSAADARRRQLLTLREVHRASGFALTTLHRWTSYEGFPEPVAVQTSKGPQPLVLRRWHDVRAFLLTQRPDADLPTKVADDVYLSGPRRGEG